MTGLKKGRKMGTDARSAASREPGMFFYFIYLFTVLTKFNALCRQIEVAGP